jgi:hypothetical protein
MKVLGWVLVSLTPLYAIVWLAWLAFNAPFEEDEDDDA